MNHEGIAKKISKIFTSTGIYPQTSKKENHRKTKHFPFPRNKHTADTLILGHLQCRLFLSHHGGKSHRSPKEPLQRVRRKNKKICLIYIPPTRRHHIPIPLFSCRSARTCASNQRFNFTKIYSPMTLKGAMSCLSAFPSIQWDLKIEQGTSSTATWAGFPKRRKQKPRFHRSKNRF